LQFVGTFDYSMDERGRVPLPPIYRDAFREGIVLSRGQPDPCLRVYTRSAFEELASEYTADSTLAQRGRDLRRAFFAASRHSDLDAQNRVLIPGPLRQYAGLERQILVVGVGEYMEIWDPARWEQEQSRIMSTIAATMEASTERRRL
jgi:MraZ protein